MLSLISVNSIIILQTIFLNHYFTTVFAFCDIPLCLLSHTVSYTSCWSGRFVAGSAAGDSVVAAGAEVGAVVGWVSFGGGGWVDGGSVFAGVGAGVGCVVGWNTELIRTW